MQTLTLLLATLTHWVVPATGEEPFLPDRDPRHGEKGGVVRLVAAQDEYEPGSFVVKSDVDLGKVRFAPDAFTNDQGVAFAAANVDLKVVKVWYQNRNGWFSYFGDTGFALCPELLLNDEDLVRIDEATASNYAKLTDADGHAVGERWINPPRQMDVRSTDWRTKLNSVFQSMRPDFKDAATLQPVSLGKDVRKQFVLTVHVPEGTPPGVYRGGVSVTDASGRRLYAIPVALRVLDFALPRPKTYFDPEKDLLVCGFNYISLDTIREMNGGDLELAKRQFRAILANQRRHGVQSYKIPTSIGAETDFYIRTMQEVGMRTDVLVGGAYPTRSLTWKDGQKKDFSYADMVADARAQAAYYDRTLGHHNVYITHGDEPSSAWIAKERPLVDAYHEAGFKFFIACHRALFHKGGHLWDFSSTSKSPDDDRTPRLWNQIGGEPYVGWYGHLHVGPENPALNRRQYGLATWLSGYSAIMNYAFSLGPWNDDSTTYKPMVNAYGIFGGVVDTLQWEGFREGIDDIRYATLLTALARRAIRADAYPTRRAGKKALRFVAEITVGANDYLGTGADPLETVRLEMIDRIEDLRARLGAAADVAERPIAAQPFAGESTDPLGGTPDLFGSAGAARYGLWTNVCAYADRALSNARERPFAVKDEARFRAFLQGYVMSGRRAEAIALCRAEGKCGFVADLLEGKAPTWSADPEAAMKEIDVAGSFMLLLNDEAKVRELAATRAALVKPRARKTYPVRYSSHALAGLGDWANATARAEPQPLDRAFGGNLDFLVTDITSGNRGAGIGTDARTNAAPVTLQVLCDRRGLHFRFDEPNADAAEVEGLARAGGSYECYLAPGAGTPYVSFVADQASGRLDVFNTTYDTFGIRAVPARGPRACRTEVAFGDGRITTYVFVPWDSYAALVPKDGDEWEFESIFWSTRGGACWNGTESIHGRSTWGRLRFVLPEEARAAIVRRQLFAAKKAYAREKVTWDSGEGVIDHWLDDDLGDPGFASAHVKPLVEALDARARELTLALPDEDVFRFERDVLPLWRDLRFVLADRRRQWLMEKLLQPRPIRECRATRAPGNWRFAKFPRMTSPATFCVRPGEPFSYQFTYESRAPFDLAVKGLGAEPLPAGLSFDSRTGVLTGRFGEEGVHRLTVTMNADGRCVQWGDLEIRVLGARPVPETLFNEAIYQLDLASFTKEGTLAAAARELPRLRDLGLTWVYLCPITASDTDPDPRFLSPRQKASGFSPSRNPYRPADFNAVEPAYGTRADFRRFVAAAHGLGLKVMTDVVFFHCGPKAAFLKDHPDWVRRDASGAFVCGGWTFPQLNFENPGLRRYLTDSLLAWISDCGVDGFRCDVGDLVPLDFWEAARREIDREKKDFVMLLEGTNPAYGRKAFDMFYGFIASHNGISEALCGRRPASWIRRQWEAERAQGPAGIAWMRCTDTHDLAADAGDARIERAWGPRRAVCGIALSFALDGVPMLWMGQEIGWQGRYSIFGPTPIDWANPPDPKRPALIRRLTALKREPAFGAKGEVIWLTSDNPDDEVLFLRRAPDGTTYRCFFNCATGDWSIARMTRK